MASGAAGGLRYQGKVAIVTGGSRGIGEGIVRVFVQNGAKVVFCAHKVEPGEALEAELNQSGPGESMFVLCDVTKEEDIKRLIDVTVEKFGQIDCLVNNAGWHPPEQKIDDTSAQDFRDLLNFNLISYFLAAKFALPHLRKTKGNIINLSSLVGIIGQNHAIPYVSTKGAITAMTKAMAVDESKYDVRVNCISPGNVWTPLWEELAKNTKDPKSTIQGGNDAQLIGRMGTVEECGKAALYLAAEATFCTGIDLLLSGGAELNYACKNQQKTRSSLYH
ncbi:17-beta-hydroxysteroid dehydrogenase 14 [Latimeria chalumnae]|uniref:17-beta-hydroxysteroid dehydrogenase 14 n=1 Tax=Latimeria chalumnae TaxID=7897 RepID=UPI0006D8E04C|nr:PREDICTED: 17-beta-hydroxysteroid dehydrogenase 14 [Latimeria chalumnae]|eukprot:XP_014352525.1 PREDICTED: 17-beta-hydroxysteroid dehydrogenase 14 [Latimeria chalumnae]